MEDVRVLICGSRTWEDEGPVREVLRGLNTHIVVIHGAARGVDAMAGRLAEEMGMKVLAFPAQWNRYGRAAGPIRNAQMLREGDPNVVYAFALDLKTSRGTANMVAQAREAGVEVVVYDVAARSGAEA